MSAFANRKATPQPWMEYGVVQKADTRQITVATDWGAILAEKAAGCLVSPMSGDTVLLCLDGAGGAFVLSVLRQANSAVATQIALDGDVNVHVRGGRFSVTADKDVALAAGQALSVSSDRIAVHAQRGMAVIEKFSFLGKSLKGQVKRVRLVAVSMEQVFQRLTQRLGDLFCFVKDQQEVQAGSARYLTEETLTMQSKNAVHMAEEIVTINAEQIQMG